MIEFCVVSLDLLAQSGTPAVVAAPGIGCDQRDKASCRQRRQMIEREAAAQRRAVR
jgi:hypothetical protein